MGTLANRCSTCCRDIVARCRYTCGDRFHVVPQPPVMPALFMSASSAPNVSLPMVVTTNPSTHPHVDSSRLIRF